MRPILLCLSVFLIASCSSKFLKYGKAKELERIEEFDSKVKIVIPDEPSPTPSPSLVAESTATPTQAPSLNVKEGLPIHAVLSKPQANSKKSKKKKSVSKIEATGESVKLSESQHLPELEDSESFLGRRPKIDPFGIGEKVVHKVVFWGVVAGRLSLEVRPYASVNDRKAYYFAMTAKTSDWYSSIYRVEDQVKTLVDFETLVPNVFSLAVKESKQLVEARMLFEDKKATFWQKKVTEEKGEEEVKESWEILEYTQNVYSAVFYMRVFNYKVGQEYAFRVSNDKENMIFKGKALRTEKLTTDLGTFDTIVVQPKIELKGKFKPIGDIFVWLSNDERKFILKIKADIQMGSLNSEVVELDKGQWIH